MPAKGVTKILVTIFICAQFCGRLYGEDQMPMNVTPEASSTKTIMAAVCDAEPVEGRRKGSWSCASCPSYVKSTTHEAFKLERIYLGSFTGAKNEALAVMSGCDRSAHEYGGTALLEKSGSSWRRTAFYPDLLSGFEECLPFKSKEDRTSLICRESYQHGGINDWIAVVRFDGTTLDYRHILDGMYSNIGEGDPCDGAVAMSVRLLGDRLSPENAFLVSIDETDFDPPPDAVCDFHSGRIPEMNKSERHRILRYSFDGKDATPEPHHTQ